jgi:hypothetical protein
MTDKTTGGYVADPADVDALLRNHCGYHLAEPDPLERYQELTQAQVLYDALVAAIRRERGRALAELVGAGNTPTRIAEMTRLGSRQMVQGLIAAGRPLPEAGPDDLRLADPGPDDLRLADPGPDELRLANPGPDDLRLADPGPDDVQLADPEPSPATAPPLTPRPPTPRPPTPPLTLVDQGLVVANRSPNHHNESLIDM